jgi:hypothetical protein
MNITKKENLPFRSAYNELKECLPIDFIMISIFVLAFVSLLILIYFKFFYSKNISASEKKILLNKRGIKLLVSFSITIIMFAFALILIKSIFWIADNLPNRSGVFIVAIGGFLILWKWNWLLNKNDE